MLSGARVRRRYQPNRGYTVLGCWALPKRAATTIGGGGKLPVAVKRASLGALLCSATLFDVF